MDFGRGDTITDLHGSEVAQWKNTEELVKGLFQAVPLGTGYITLESTGRGQQGYFYRRVMGARAGADGLAEDDPMLALHDRMWRLVFLPWHEFPEYQFRIVPNRQARTEAGNAITLTEAEAAFLLQNPRTDLGEDALIADWGLGPGRLMWRRWKLAEFDWDLSAFRQEYPMTVEECFQASGASIFAYLRETNPSWRSASPLSGLAGHPRPGFTYIIGADASAGLGADRSVAHVSCVQTREQVAEWVDNRTDPHEFGQVLADLGTRYNRALLVVESNSHGLTTLAMLLRGGGSGGQHSPIYPPHLVYSAERGAIQVDDRELGLAGFRTTVRTKPLLIGVLRRVLAKKLYQVWSTELHSELDAYVAHPDGSWGAATGEHDDRVIAAALALQGWDKATLFLPGGLETAGTLGAGLLTLEALLAEGERNFRVAGGGRFPIPRQARRAGAAGQTAAGRWIGPPATRQLPHLWGRNASAHT